jgi:hypothetical protein
MRKIIVVSVTSLLILTIIGGTAVYVFLSNQDRGITADGRMAPPASVRNADEAPKYDSGKPEPTKKAEKLPEPQLPTEFKLPTELDITTPQVPEGLAAPATGPKS